MKDRPILFSAPMVRALLAGTKTQTRRVVKMQPPEGTTSVAVYHHPDDRDGRPRFWSLGPDPEAHGATDYLQPDWALPCPYGAPGDRLYVRETWQHENHPDGPFQPGAFVFYRADYLDDPHGPDGEKSPEGRYRTWRPAIHMPREASRIDLEVTGVRVERLQDISEADADAEGCERLDSEREVHDWKLCPRCGGTRLHNALGPNLGVIFDVDCQHCDTYVKRYRHLWEAINGTGSWAANPWVWVVEFRRVRP